MSSADVIVSFIFTWTLGLAPPAVVRYLAYRRPLQAAEALSWAVGLGICQAITLVLLGSDSKTHYVVLLIGYVAFRILRIASGRWDRSPQKPTRRIELDSPKRRIAAVIAIVWVVTTIVFVGLSYYENSHAEDARIAADLWGKRYQEQVVKYCGKSTGNERCSAGEAAYTMLMNQAQWEADSRQLSIVYLSLAGALIVGVPAILMFAIWIRTGKWQLPKR